VIEFCFPQERSSNVMVSIVMETTTEILLDLMVFMGIVLVVMGIIVVSTDMC